MLYIAQISERDEEIVDWKRKHAQATDRFNKLKEKLEGVERYLADLPTLEEFTKNAEDISFCTCHSAVKALFLPHVYTNTINIIIISIVINRPELEAPVVSFSKILDPHCLVLVDSRKGMESDLNNFFYALTKINRLNGKNLVTG